MPNTIDMPPLVITGTRFPNVFVFPRNRIMDPDNNVLLVANLFNFKIDGDQPRRDHELFLSGIVAPMMIANPASGARLIGLASRSGADRHNLLLSRRRARNVETSLQLFLAADSLINPPSSPRTSSGGQGEFLAANLKVKDGTEDARFRSVLLTVLADRTKNSLVRLLP